MVVLRIKTSYFYFVIFFYKKAANAEFIILKNQFLRLVTALHDPPQSVPSQSAVYCQSSSDDYPFKCLSEHPLSVTDFV